MEARIDDGEAGWMISTASLIVSAPLHSPLLPPREAVHHISRSYMQQGSVSVFHPWMTPCSVQLVRGSVSSVPYYQGKGSEAACPPSLDDTPYYQGKRSEAVCPPSLE
ncbi:hypothetical protein E2C01_019671 [Portunus trituberculatus]|uniref:Uncharacterized protein n=1 Tax=Portunus trituberculatus TaxID=210409 RepID=A0A5B7DYK3_PORTR|nr:hypothetical protein [Portunus trituberculatus]